MASATLPAAPAGKPTVSVIVPCYNCRDTLCKTLDSLKRQTMTEWEAVIVNDACTDASRELAATYAQCDDRFHIVDHDVNRGLAAARNTGIRHARADLLNFLDADDLLRPNALEIMHRGCNERPECGGVYGCWTRLYPQGETIPIIAADESQISFQSLCKANTLQVPAIMVRRSVLAKSGVFDERLRRGEDWDLWIRVYRAGYRLGRIATDLALYRMNPCGLSHNYFEQWKARTEVVEMVHGVDDRCVGCRPEYLAGPGEESRLVTHKSLIGEHLCLCIVGEDVTGACRIVDLAVKKGLPFPEPEHMGAGLAEYALRYVPGGRNMFGPGWNKTVKVLDVVLRKLGVASGRKDYAQTFFMGVSCVAASSVDCRGVLGAAIRHGLWKRPRRALFLALRTYGLR